MTWMAWDGWVVALLAMGGAAAWTRRRRSSAATVLFFVAAVSAAVCIACIQRHWPLAAESNLLLRVFAAMATVWSACGWAAHAAPGHSNADDAASVRQVGPSPLSASAGFFAGAAACGLAALSLAAVLVGAALAGRFLPPGPFEAPQLTVAPALALQGRNDLLLLAAPWMFWRFAGPDRLQPVAAVFIGAALVAWTALMIPGSIWSDAPRGSSPDGLRTWNWTRHTAAGLAAVVAVATWARERSFRRMRRAAIPSRPLLLLDGYPEWPGYRRATAALAAGVLLLGVLHLVRPSAGDRIGGCIHVLAGAVTAVCCLFVAHRDWSTTLAGLGPSLFALSAATAATLATPFDPALDYDPQVPARQTATIIGLTAMVFLCFWLPEVWRQQLDGGRAWTTAGRLIPHGRRAAFLMAALGVLVALNVALWPLQRVAVGGDDSIGRWVAGLAAHLFLLVVTARFVQSPRDVPLATISLAAAATAVLFVVVRLPAAPWRGWLIQHAAVALALATLPILAAAEALPGSRRAAYAAPLWITALLVLPAAALALSVRRPPAEWSQPMTLATLAITYAIAGARERRRALLLLAAMLLATAGYSLIVKFRLLSAYLAAD